MKYDGNPIWQYIVVGLIVAITGLGLSKYVYADYPGEYRAELISIRDGDTFVFKIDTWLNTFVVEPVRVRGIDTPEKYAKKPCERILSNTSTSYAATLLSGRDIVLKNIKSKRTFDRAVADVYVDNVNFADLMVLKGHARKCTKCKNGHNWCE